MFGASSIHSKFDKLKAGSNCKPCAKIDCSKKCPMIPIPDCMKECHCPQIDDNGGGDSDNCLDKIKEIESLKTQIKYLQEKMENTDDKSDKEDNCKSCPNCLTSIDDCPTLETSPKPELIIPDEKPCPFTRPCDCIDKKNETGENNSNNSTCPKCECSEKPCECENNIKSYSKKYLPPPCPDCPVCDTDQKPCPNCESCENEDSSPRPFSLYKNYFPPLV